MPEIYCHRLPGQGTGLAGTPLSVNKLTAGIDSTAADGSGVAHWAAAPDRVRDRKSDPTAAGGSTQSKTDRRDRYATEGAHLSDAN